VGEDTLRIVESEGPRPSSGTIRTGAGKVVAAGRSEVALRAYELETSTSASPSLPSVPSKLPRRHCARPERVSHGEPKDASAPSSPARSPSGVRGHAPSTHGAQTVPVPAPAPFEAAEPRGFSRVCRAGAGAVAGEHQPPTQNVSPFPDFLAPFPQKPAPFSQFSFPAFRLDFTKPFRSTPSLLDFGIEKSLSPEKTGPAGQTLPPLQFLSLPSLHSSPSPSLSSPPFSPSLDSIPSFPFPPFLFPSGPTRRSSLRSRTYGPGDISGDKGLVSAGRIDKDTPPRTTPRRTSKSSAMDTPSHMFEVELRGRPGARFRGPSVRPVPTLARGAYSCSRKEREGSIAAFWHGFRLRGVQPLSGRW
jgi:hypothetical protein